MKASDLIKALNVVSEKAGNVARICRQDECLLSLLVQEKKDSEKNPRFITDFKTLADVLVQEMVKHDLGSQFPALYGHIYGEENNQFVSNGEIITIEIKESVDETAELLCKIIGDIDASRTLASAVNSYVDDNMDINFDSPDLPENIGLWIDPIDSTAEYIRGGINTENDLVVSGLPCVTVLLGVFDRDSGVPLIGVVNQPFYEQEEGGWRGRSVFGITCNNFKLSQPSFDLANTKVVAVSTSEKENIKSCLKENGYEIVEIAGAGYKLLNIILGHVCAYVLSKPTSFLWDVCACHAILESIDGGIIDFTNLMPIKYKGGVGISECCNSGGIIAYRNNTVKEDMISILKLPGI